ncbi:MAG: beta galactosidase jelly roll domain-containing protein [Bacteroides sp.]|nr:beta galactosidase jelly roll domain-containing protein [Bacteroides sp.]
MFPCHARQTIPFNDGWQFKKGPFTAATYPNVRKWNTPWEEISLPHTWNAQDMQKQVNSFYEGAAYYRKTFHLPDSWNDKRIYLRFEGVGSCAEVYVNGQLITTHKGAYSAFACEIGPALRPGEENEIVVCADNTARPDVIPVNHSLFGIYGGIYRPVWLIVTDPVHIAVTDHASPGIYITQKNVSPAQAGIEVRVKVDNGSKQLRHMTLHHTVYTQDGTYVMECRQPVTLPPSGIQTVRSQFTLQHPRLWQGLDDPHLYKVTTRLTEGEHVLDSMEQPLGVRSFRIVAGEGFYLNGQKYPMYGVTRHQDWWEIGSALHREHHDRDLELIRELGATTIRLAHYQQSEYFYSRCDSLGLIVWAEIPFVNRVTGEESENAKNQLRELIRQNFNHPSIYVWGLHNEVYHPHSYTAQLTQELHDLAQTEDPDRFTVAVNGYGHMDHPVNGKADIQGMNRYFGWYEKKIQDILPWIEDLQTHYPDQPFMLTEYGADANIYQQTEYLEDALNWTRPFYPETFQTKTHEFQWKVISDHPYIIASYLWNTFDFAVPMWNRGGIPARNMKGLITFDRQTKKDSFYWYKANWSREPVLYITQRRNTEREKQNTSVTVYSNMDTPTLTLNGKELKTPRQGYTEVHYIFDDVQLEYGTNILTTRVVAAGNEYEDCVEWHYHGEKQRKADFYEHREEHSGF